MGGVALTQPPYNNFHLPASLRLSSSPLRSPCPHSAALGLCYALGSVRGRPQRGFTTLRNQQHESKHTVVIRVLGLLLRRCCYPLWLLQALAVSLKR
jgi:hypothetical protein